MSGGRGWSADDPQGSRAGHMSADRLHIVSCRCDPRHLEVGAYDHVRFIHRPIPEARQFLAADDHSLMTAKRERP
jgi:hypothetical protein